MVNRTANMPNNREIGSKTIPEHADVKLINAKIVLNSVQASVHNDGAGSHF